MSMVELSKEINEINKKNGWNTIRPEDWFQHTYKVPAILALIHSEVSETLEAYRKDDRKNFEEEMADIIIRTLDCCGGLGIDIDAKVSQKMEKNKLRTFRHGGKRL